MAVPIEKTQHPVALFCQNLFRTSTAPATVSTAQVSVSLADLEAMPKGAQLLLAHALEQKNPDLTLLEIDTDVCRLLSAGWLTSVPCTTVGISCFKIKPAVWRRLRALTSTFLNDDLLSDLKSYRKRKGTLYPWAW